MTDFISWWISAPFYTQLDRVLLWFIAVLNISDVTVFLAASDLSAWLMRSPAVGPVCDL